MRIIYIADDGTQFDDEYDCKDYEWKLNHSHLKDVHIFDKDGKEFENILSDDAYHYSAKIVVTSNEAVKGLRDLANYTGYCYYEQVNKVGEWRFDEAEEKFVMTD